MATINNNEPTSEKYSSHVCRNNSEGISSNDKSLNAENLDFFVCSNKIIRIVKLLLSDIRVDVNKANKYGETPFYIACENGHIEIVKYLLACRREVDINKKGNDGKVGKTGKTGLDIARESEKEKKGKWDSEEYFQQRKKKYRNIVEFLKQFKSNPIETRLKLRIKLGFAGKYFIIYLNLFFIFYFLFTNHNSSN